MSERVIYVAALNLGYEGRSLPVLAFYDRATALRWAAGQRDIHDITEVPVHPNVPSKPWAWLEPEQPLQLRLPEPVPSAPNTDDPSTLSPSDAADPRRTG